MGSHTKMLGLQSILLVFLATATPAQEDTTTTTSGLPTTTPTPCWLEAFPPPNITRAGNELTCEICTVIFEGLDDTLLNNEEQIAHALENLVRECLGCLRFAGGWWRPVLMISLRCLLKVA